MKRRRVCSLVVLAAGLGLLVPAGLTIFAQAQQPGPPGIRVRQVQVRRNFARNAGDPMLLDGVFLPPDRQAKRRLELADELIAERRFGEAVRLLGSLLENTEDFFFKPDADQPVFRSLKSQAGRLLADLPDDGRASYELQFGAQARQMLGKAAAASDLAQVAEVSRRFFFTHAGAEATFLLGRHYMDQNRPLAAALCFERLLDLPDVASRLEPALSLSLASCWLRSGKPAKAQAALADFKRRHTSGAVVLAGKPVKLFADESRALAWMEKQFGKQPVVTPVEADQWVMFRGDESRNAPSSGGQPLLSMRWRQRTSDDRAIEEFVAKLRHDYTSQEIVALSSMHPLAVSDVVLMRTAFALQAVDFETGKLVWKYATGGESLEAFLRALGSRQTGQSTQQLLKGLNERMWEDATYGTLSSDGEQVYYIEDLTLGGLTSKVVMTVLPNGQRRYSVNTEGTNRLAARELRTQGKLKWQIGGVTGEDEPNLGGAFFLGPPLPLLGNLYALAEVKGQEIRLVVLSPETGALEWSQQLAVVDPPVTQDKFRRNSGATPSFADGVLVCPTTAGAIVGIDLSTRSLLWGYQYPRAQQYVASRFRRRRATIYAGSQSETDERWADASITIADGRVLVTPVETDQLYCLDLANGEEQWKKDRGENLYVACVHSGMVILVGHNSVSALKLADGTKAWPELALPDRSMPSGRGFYSGEHFYLPLSSAEVAKINLSTGRIESRARSRSGTVPGNLICYRDSIVSQGADFLEAYYQLDALKERIAKSLSIEPDDPRALAALGEVKLDEGALDEAIELFRRSYELAAEETTRVQLIESLLDGLRADFAAYRDRLGELDRLVERPRHRLDFLRLKAIGEQRSGEVLAAFETYMQLVDEQAPWELEDIDAHLSVRRDRWIREQLAQLRAAAEPQEEEQIDAVVIARLERALAAQSADALRNYMNVFGSHPAAARARVALAAELAPDDLLERNLLWEKQAMSSQDAVAGPATARLALALRAAGQDNLAAVYYRQLAGRFAEVVCLDDNTGRQLVDELAADDPLRAPPAASRHWPTGSVAVREEKGTIRGARARGSQRTSTLEIVGQHGQLFKNVSLSLTNDSRYHLQAKDGVGKSRFRIDLTQQGMPRMPTNRAAYNAPSINYASVYGGLMVLSLGSQLVAIDTLRGDAASNRVLWTENLNDQIGGLATMQSIVPRAVKVKWGQAQFAAEDSFGRRYGRIGPVSQDGVCFQRLHDLHCVDPMSGKTVWTRRNVDLGLDLFGDDEYLFAAPQDDGETLVLRASTGELLGKRRIPPVEQRMTTLGRQVLSWLEADGGYRMEMRDVWLDRALWSLQFTAGSKAAIISQDAVGVFQRDGRFALVRLADGKRLVDERLHAEDKLERIYLLPSEEAYLLVVQGALRGRSTVAMQPFPNVHDCPLVSGRVYAFDHTTGKQHWPAPVAVSQHGLLLSQPRDLPVLVLVRQMHKSGRSSSREQRLSVMCIDKRSGRLVYHKDDLPGTTVPLYDLYCDPRAHTVTISLPSQLITLTYTNDPADGQSVMKADGRAVGRALAGATERREPSVRWFESPDAVSR